MYVCIVAPAWNLDDSTKPAGLCLKILSQDNKNKTGANSCTVFVVWVSIHKQCSLMEISMSNLWRRSSYSIISSDNAHGENGVTIWVVQRQQYTLQTDLRSDWTISTSPKQNKINNDNNPPRPLLSWMQSLDLSKRLLAFSFPWVTSHICKNKAHEDKEKKAIGRSECMYLSSKSVYSVYRTCGKDSLIEASCFFWEKVSELWFTCLWIALLCKLSNKVRKAGTDTADPWQSEICNM